MFKPLTPSDYTTLLPYFDNQVHRLCFYSLSAFICWTSPVARPEWTIDNGLLLVAFRYSQDSGKDYLYLPIAHGSYLSPEQLHALAEKHGFSHYHHVPGEYVDTQEANDLNRWFHVNEAPELADYVYNTQDLATLNGKKYSKKRNLINQFFKTHVDPGRVVIHDFTRKDIPECLNFLEFWTEERDMKSSDSPWAMMEYHAAKHAVESIETLGYKGCIMRIDGDVKAFGLGSTLTADLGGYHFEKADPYIKGLYQYFDKQCVRRLFPDVPYINKECDMGEPGLRQSKRSYYPVDYVRAYELKCR